MEKNGKMEKINNNENSGPLTLLPVDRLTATDCNATARANSSFIPYILKIIKVKFLQHIQTVKTSQNLLEFCRNHIIKCYKIKEKLHLH